MAAYCASDAPRQIQQGRREHPVFRSVNAKLSKTKPLNPLYLYLSEFVGYLLYLSEMLKIKASQ
jgi:hypothetical protein